MSSSQLTAILVQRGGSTTNQTLMIYCPKWSTISWILCPTCRYKKAIQPSLPRPPPWMVCWVAFPRPANLTCANPGGRASWLLSDGVPRKFSKNDDLWNLFKSCSVNKLAIFLGVHPRLLQNHYPKVFLAASLNGSLADPRRFLDLLFRSPHPPDRGTVLDCGAGIGRAGKHRVGRSVKDTKNGGRRKKMASKWWRWVDWLPI